MGGRRWELSLLALVSLIVRIIIIIIILIIILIFVLFVVLCRHGLSLERCCLVMVGDGMGRTDGGTSRVFPDRFVLHVLALGVLGLVRVFLLVVFLFLFLLRIFH